MYRRIGFYLKYEKTQLQITSDPHLPITPLLTFLFNSIFLIIIFYTTITRCSSLRKFRTEDSEFVFLLLGKLGLVITG